MRPLVTSDRTSDSSWHENCRSFIVLDKAVAAGEEEEEEGEEGEEVAAANAVYR